MPLCANRPKVAGPGPKWECGLVGGWNSHHTDYRTVGRKVEPNERRKEQHMTQAGLAGKIGVTDNGLMTMTTTNTMVLIRLVIVDWICWWTRYWRRSSSTWLTSCRGEFVPFKRVRSRSNKEYDSCFRKSSCTCCTMRRSRRPGSCGWLLQNSGIT